MTRTLPWLADEPKSKGDSEKRAQKRQRTLNTFEADTANPRFDRNRRNGRRTDGRSPSTSPPPEPPTEEFMVEGPEHDDAYIMVEDEFNAVAKTFTQHLHHAEYVRLKNQAKSRNASAINDMSRPVDTITKMPVEVKKRIAAKASAKEKQKTLEQLSRKDTETAGADDDLEEDDPWIGTSLHGLMASPRKAQRLLPDLTAVKSNTKAAAGYQKERRNLMQSDNFRKSRSSPVLRETPVAADDESTESEDDEEELDALPYKRANAVPKRETTQHIKQERQSVQTSVTSRSSRALEKRAPTSRVSDLSKSRSMSTSPDPDSPKPSLKVSPQIKADLLDHIPRPSTLPYSKPLRKRKEATQPHSRADEQSENKIAKRRSALLREIPTFL
ncbi:MAG: hypothetical protein M4579_003568 [Chaenotheca gracillima]|nr:MAG: hypothetical protein M4579_003568 [Chaenotheca gracillima]